MSDLITEEAREYKSFIEKTWPQFDVKLEQPLRSLFPKPVHGCIHIWTFGSADVVVRKRDRVIAIFEPGGSHHFTDKKQIRNDRAKWKLCDINGVGCLRMANSVFKNLSNRKRRSMIGKFLFPRKTE